MGYDPHIEEARKVKRNNGTYTKIYLEVFARAKWFKVSYLFDERIN